jgi:intracellular sulfur oxidation DsrE/DsrF family protein
MKCFIRSLIFGAALLPAVLPLVGNMAVAAEAEPVARVVWHVDFGDPRRLSAMTQNVNNMVTTYQNQLEDFDIRIVFLAAGIRFVTNDPLKGTPFAEDAALKARRKELLERVKSLHDTQNIKLELCEITRESVPLDREKLLAGVELVPSGVVRIAELQHQGFAYLKTE